VFAIAVGLRELVARAGLSGAVVEAAGARAVDWVDIVVAFLVPALVVGPEAVFSATASLLSLLIAAVGRAAEFGACRRVAASRWAQDVTSTIPDAQLSGATFAGS
jgi:uncharacterized membrane protein YqaE (UPF0057 family)